MMLRGIYKCLPMAMRIHVISLEGAPCSYGILDHPSETAHLGNCMG